MKFETIVLTFSIGLFLTPRPIFAGVLPPTSTVAGKSQAAWGDSWWKWALSYPASSNPITDPTGALANLGDQGQVFFLGGSLGPSATRSATVKQNQTLLLPLGDSVSWIPTYGANEAAIRADAAATEGSASGLFLTIDGVPAVLPAQAPSLTNYHQVSPTGTFPLTFPANDVFGFNSPGTYQSDSDGYWVMLDGLSPGPHVLHYGGNYSGTPGLYDPFGQNTTYNLTVTPVPEPHAIALISICALLALRRRF